MKVSTQQFFDKSLGYLQKAQSDAAKSNEQLSTGKSLVRASDDTLKLRAVANLDRAITALDNRNSNVELLLSRFSLEESILRSASDVTARIRELAIQSSNATYSAQDRKLMGAEVASLRDHLLALSNTKDSEGGSLFGGSRTATDPFIEAIDGRVIYQGDEEVMKVEVGENRFLSKNRGGLQVFAGVIRAHNNGEEKKVGFFDVIDDFVTSLTSPKKTQITVSEDELSTNTGQLTINGVEISKTEDIPDLDEIIRRINLESGRTNVTSFKNEAGDIVIENVDGFEGENIAFGDAPGLLLSIEGVVGPSEDSRLWERSISELGIIHDELSFAIGRAGSEMNSAEYQKELNLDAEVRLKQLRSSQVDVDFAEVVSRFNAELARLEASQAAFAKLSRMTLFEYL